ncbi:predicted protein [Thalassiosira pseudonana CCMP1335]|uniref:Uncharacterized protein n=1 Tax=Thalassiosira pseudonana TaxID=35128 RepID=B8C0U3_THAPS|nr:predicted protein [Thalassiosira pseudonana CCMP1335]EED92662.1 predicted protein [Thalassiosira pseudonana CCMP1335]|eukprot:g12708.t1 g12708   contig6:2488866-2491019(-)
MNYAEDRLDRRARSASSRTSATADELASDLQRAHDVFRRCSNLNCDLQHEHSIEYGATTLGRSESVNRHESTITSLQELRAAHELAGKTLRDGGSNRQAVFHFGMAWKICHWLDRSASARCTAREHLSNIDNVASDDSTKYCPEWKSVGDYAQMAELSGFPEVGVLALLFCRAGGQLNLSETAEVETETTPSDKTENEGTSTSSTSGCGCGMAECGISPCFIAFPTSSSVIDMVLQDLDEINTNNPHQQTTKSKSDRASSTVTALEILNQLAVISGKSSKLTNGDRFYTMQQFMNERTNHIEIPSTLRFWEDKNSSNNLHPVLLLLLLKLLYSSPISGSFLKLACYSIPYLSAMLPSSSPGGRHLAMKYKSHWAYYVFIRSVVLGERVKKNRVDRRMCHTPVWDIVVGTDENAGLLNGADALDENAFSSCCRSILNACTATNEEQTIPKTITLMPRQCIYALGDSHVLSLAWQTLCIDSTQTTHPNSQGDISTQDAIHRVIIPYPVTGIKAWHFRSSTRFFTHYNLRTCLERLQLATKQQRRRAMILSAGEIDCREGIGGTLLQGYYQDCQDAVEQTVLQYLGSLSSLAEEFMLQILVMPVAPHAYRSEKNGKAMGRAKRRETMALWNDTLRKELVVWEEQSVSEQSSSHRHASQRKYEHVFLLDYEEQLRHADQNSPVGYVLHPSYNADYTHCNSAIVPLVEQALVKCGYDLNLVC